MELIYQFGEAIIKRLGHRKTDPYQLNIFKAQFKNVSISEFK